MLATLEPKIMSSLHLTECKYSRFWRETLTLGAKLVSHLE